MVGVYNIVRVLLLCANLGEIMDFTHIQGISVTIRDLSSNFCSSNLILLGLFFLNDSSIDLTLKNLAVVGES